MPGDPSPARAPMPDAIARGRVITIVRGEYSTAAVLGVGDALSEAGITAVEVTLNSPSALASITALSERHAEHQLTVGAGTVLDVASAQSAVDAGARFLVTPTTDPDVIGWAARRGVPIFPGAMTPTEILLAWSSGATAVKLFPASVCGPGYVRDLAGPLGDIPLVAVGGITAENAAAFLGAGVGAVGVGSWLIGDAEPGGVRRRAASLVASLGAER
ncbi:MAG: 2-dehydro-3-deoxyphosphogluconate aldolase / (4S)-4-hydroxy-2-oxoglutarate aldolase [Solirubrobacteraceae bacterium]|nr:2-dehydro-3-deoxyphosphogluconate aldolase / (4S)-4-hydroxy-2-oxoglutarate aldolase [Solirubrobacteraceae bacterium]